MLGGKPLNLKVEGLEDVEGTDEDEQNIQTSGTETRPELNAEAKPEVKTESKPGYKPGRIDGKNSGYVSGSHFVPKKIYHQVEVLLQQNRDKAAKSDKKVSARTQEIRRTNIRNFFSDLFKLKYKIQSVYNIKPKHLEAVFNFLEVMGQSPSSIQNKISTMRIFCGWIGKADMVKDSSTYVKDKASARRTTVAKEDKSWVGNGIDVLTKLAEIYAGNYVVGIWLELCWVFGMRIQEAVMFRPFVAITDGGIWIREGTKGDRGRFIPFETEIQFRILEKALTIADGKTGFTGPRGMTGEQKLEHFKNELKKYGITLAKNGVTAHGLRHQYMHAMFKKITGIEPPIRGGDVIKLDKQQLHYAKQRLSELAGHIRTDITSAYYGSDRNPSTEEEIKNRPLFPKRKKDGEQQ